MAVLQKGVEIQLKAEADMPQVWMDRDKMDHIVDNLLSNALKYTEKGIIYITVRTNEEEMVRLK